MNDGWVIGLRMIYGFVPVYHGFKNYDSAFEFWVKELEADPDFEIQLELNNGYVHPDIKHMDALREELERYGLPEGKE